MGWICFEVGNWLIIIIVWLLWYLYFCFYLCLNDNMQSRFYVHWSLLDMCLIFQLFICFFDCWLFLWLLVTEMGWPGVGAVWSHVVKALQGLLCGSSVSKHDWKRIFGGGSVSKMCSYEDCWQPNNCLYYVCFLLFFCYGVSFVFCCFAWTCGGSDLYDSYGRRFPSLYSW